MAAAPQFDHEKLEVYQLELQFIAWVTTLFAELKEARPPRLAETLDQLDRASISQVLNTAEGNGRRGSLQRARFSDDARGSATECAGCLDILVAKGAVGASRIQKGKELLVRVVSILSKLIERFGGQEGGGDSEGFSRTRTRTRTSRRTRTG
jgi:four helix bundle protein